MITTIIGRVCKWTGNWEGCVSEESPDEYRAVVQACQEEAGLWTPARRHRQHHPVSAARGLRGGRTITPEATIF